MLLLLSIAWYVGRVDDGENYDFIILVLWCSKTGTHYLFAIRSILAYYMLSTIVFLYHIRFLVRDQVYLVSGNISIVIQENSITELEKFYFGYLTKVPIRA